MDLVIKFINERGRNTSQKLYPENTSYCFYRFFPDTWRYCFCIIFQYKLASNRGYDYWCNFYGGLYNFSHY